MRSAERLVIFRKPWGCAMSVEFARGRFDTRGRIRRPHVYMLVAYDECCGEFAFVKFGYSVDAYARAGGLRTACPLPWIRYTIIECTDVETARSLERALLYHFASASCGGEWLKVRWLDAQVRTDLLKRTAAIVKTLIVTPTIIEVDPVEVTGAVYIKRRVNQTHPYRLKKNGCAVR